jgi:hypothetical protein
MSWDMPILVKPDEAPPLEFTRLFMGFILCLLVIVFGCVVYYYSSHDKSAFLFLLILGLCLFVLFGIAAGWKILRAGMLMESNDLIESSNKKAEDICRGWVSEYISVIDFSSIFPDGIEIDKFSQGYEFNVVGDKSIKFPEEVDYTSLFQELLSSLRYKLLILSQTDKIEISLSGPETLSLSLWQSLSLAWKTLELPENAVTNPTFLVKNYTDQIDEWLEHPGDKFRLIVACNPLVSDDSRHLTSDGACAWLLAPKGITEQLPQKGRLYRALDTNSSVLQSDLSNFLKYQEGAMEIKKLWFDKVDGKNTVNKITQICNETLMDEEDSNLLSQYFTELILGRQGSCSIWMTMALVFLNGKSNNTSNLIISQCETKTLLVQMTNIPLHKELL